MSEAEVRLEVLFEIGFTTSLDLFEDDSERDCVLIFQQFLGIRCELRSGFFNVLEHRCEIMSCEEFRDFFFVVVSRSNRLRILFDNRLDILNRASSSEIGFHFGFESIKLLTRHIVIRNACRNQLLAFETSAS